MKIAKIARDRQRSQEIARDRQEIAKDRKDRQRSRYATTSTMVPMLVLMQLRTVTVMTGASAADTSELRVLRARLTNVPHLRTTLWTSLLGCGVLLRSLTI